MGRLAGSGTARSAALLWSDSNNSIRFQLFRKEQRALVTDCAVSARFPLVVRIMLPEGVGNPPTSAMPILFSRQVQPTYICLPSKIGCQGWTRTNTARLNRPACYFDTTWQWRCCQRRSHLHGFRLEDGCLIYSTTAAIKNWSAHAGFAPAVTPGPNRACCYYTTHCNAPRRFKKRWSRRNAMHRNPGNQPRGKIGNWRSRWRTYAPTLFPQTTELLFCSATRAKWWEGAGNAPVVASGFILRHPIYSRAAGSLPI